MGESKEFVANPCGRFGCAGNRSSAPEGRLKGARRFNAGNLARKLHPRPVGAAEPRCLPRPPLRAGVGLGGRVSPALKRWAIFGRPSGAKTARRPAVVSTSDGFAHGELAGGVGICHPRAWLCALLVGGLLSALPGCTRPETPPASTSQPEAKPARTVAVVKPVRAIVRRRIEQPGFNVEAFQETPVFAKIAGYVRAVKVDIGDPIHKDDVLAELWVPEMEVELRQKEAAARQAEAGVRQARAGEETAQANLERVQSQYQRLSRVGQSGVLDKESVEETRLGAKAARAAADRAKADVAAAEASLELAQANRDYAKTMLDYARLRAPFDGIVTRRNVNVGHFVQPAAAGGKGEPLFVVDQFDPVRVFVNVPGADAPWVRNGDPVTLRVQGAGGEEFTGAVTRTARSLTPQARTLRTEVDVPNPGHKLLPGMYVHATITVQHANAWTLPAAAVAVQGDQAVCYRVEDGKAVRTPLQIGLSGGGVVEVLKKQTHAAPGQEAKWEDFTGTEVVVAGGVEGVQNGEPVKVVGP